MDSTTSDTESAEAPSPASTGPLHGVRVVELGVWIAGPACGGILADWGADVVKIEPPEGDPSRLFHALLGAQLPSNPIFEQDNRSKRGVMLDLATPEGLDAALALIAEADVFVTNVRRGGLERLGLDYDSLAERFPSLIYCHVTGFGREGEDADRPAFDIAAFWSRAGIASLLTAPGQAPPNQRGGMGDHNTGLAAAGAISAALFERTSSGLGQLVSTSLFREGMYTISFDLNTKLMWGSDIGPYDRNVASNPAVNSYVLGDGNWIWVVGIDPQRHWAPMCRALGLDQLIDDERFATPVERRTNAAILIPLLDEAFAALTIADVEAARVTEPDFFWAPVNTLDDLLADVQFNDSGVLLEVPDGFGGSSFMVASPVDFSRTPINARAHAPELGEHNDEVMAELAQRQAASPD